MKTIKRLFVMLLATTLVLGITACTVPGSQNQNQTDNPGGNPTPDGAEVENIAISGEKTDFEVGDSFRFDGLVVEATMSDGTKKTLSSNEYTVSSPDYNCMKVGTYRVTVTVKDTDISESYDVTVSPATKLKVLMIGNSYADDTINYAHEIARASGIPAENILVADIYIGGCSLDTHWNNVLNNSAAYRFGLEKAGYFDGKSYTGWTMEQAIMYADWDFITLQQNSGNSGLAHSYSNLQNLMDYVMDVATDSTINPNANPDVKLVWHQTWAYAENSPNTGFGGYNYSQAEMYNAILSCLESEVLTKDFVAIIPNGTAIQNARTSFIGDAFSRDQYDHLSEGAGRYIASLGLVSVLTGRDLSDITWKPTDGGFNFPMSDEMIVACKESLANAIANPYEITLSKYPPKGLSEFFEGQGTQESPYLIQSADDMRKLSEITEGKSFGDKDMYFKLTADIDLGTESWQPICSSAAEKWVEVANSFNANFDGNGKTITFVGNYTGDTWAKGLFSAVGGYVHDLTLCGSISIEKGRVGSLASMAMAGARIENITSYVNITAGNNQIGGIIGYIASSNVTLTNCVNYGTIEGRELVGGIVGGGWTNITYVNCANHGTVTATQGRCGGIAGEKASSATLTNCTNNGTVTAGGTAATSDVGVASKYVGFLIGQAI